MEIIPLTINQNANNSGFNEAMTFRSWKCIIAALCCLTIDCFNEAMTFRSWKYVVVVVRDGDAVGFNEAMTFRSWKCRHRDERE